MLKCFIHYEITICTLYKNKWCCIQCVTYNMQHTLWSAWSCSRILRSLRIFECVCSSLFKCSFCVLGCSRDVSLCYFTFLMQSIQLNCFIFSSALRLFFFIESFILVEPEFLIRFSKSFNSHTPYSKPYWVSKTVVQGRSSGFTNPPGSLTLNNIQHKNLKIHFQACQIFRLAIIIKNLILTF